MKNINLQFLKEFGEYVEYSELFGYVYKLGKHLFSFNRNGLNKIK